ncbi:MAG: site-2 protease family protein, partial [Alphaproteobacteria bacterium]
MFGRKLKVATLLGFAVYIDLSWLFLAALITWSLASSVFPVDYPGLALSTYWIMGAIGALGLFVSILSHELAHSVVARRFGIPIRGITLFIFGGVAEMEDEPPSAKSEFLMAAAGPLWSVVLAGLFYLAASLGSGAPPAVHGTLSYLALMNALLAGFNILPAFPLDGGRVFRAGLWHLRKDFVSATRLA